MAVAVRKSSREFLDLLHHDMQLPHNRYINTPLVQMICNHRLPHAAIKDFAVFRWSFQANANLAMMLAHASFLRGEDAFYLLENAFDEIMRPKGQGDHPSLWVTFAKACGATDEELNQAAAASLPEVVGFGATLREYSTRSAEEGLAAWYADEEQLPEALGSLGFALRKYYGMSSEALEYFFEHVRADVDHSDASEALLLRYCDTPERQHRARKAANVTLWSWVEMHNGILRELRKRHDIPA
jgi:pyrroloquinoline quinone (PQQ) biosynthesis protein C